MPSPSKLQVLRGLAWIPTACTLDLVMGAGSNGIPQRYLCVGIPCYLDFRFSRGLHFLGLHFQSGPCHEEGFVQSAEEHREVCLACFAHSKQGATLRQHFTSFSQKNVFHSCEWERINKACS